MRKRAIATFVLIAAIPAALAQNNKADEAAKGIVQGRAVEAVIWGMR
jgi:hypothetical protein